jgi:hypothetical protein
MILNLKPWPLLLERNISMKKELLVGCLLSLLILLGGYASANAINLVSNPDFALWNAAATLPDGWTAAPSNNPLYPPYRNTAGLPDANQITMYSVDIGTSYYDFVTLSQSMATVPGATYNFSFWAYVIVDPSQADPYSNGMTAPYLPELQTYWNGQLINDIFVTGDWWHYSFQKTATSTNTLISFKGRNGLASTLVDDVSVEGTSQAVPEPATILFFGSGLIVLAGIRRKIRS